MSNSRILAGVVTALVVAAAAFPIAGWATAPGKVGRIAFGIKSADGNTDLYSMLPDGSAAQRLTSGASFDACPSYSPNGRQIGYCSDQTGTFQIWVMQADGKSARQVSRSAHDALFPRYSPDGRRLAFESNGGGPPAVDIYVVDARGGKARRFTGAPGNDVSPTYSPDGSTIAFISARKGKPQIWLMNASDGRNQRALTRDAIPKGERVDWSPDGKLLVYEAAGDLWVMNADGTQARNITHSKGIEFGPTWSPDSEEIAFVRIDGASKRAYIMNVDGSHPHPVGGPTGSQLVPTWQSVH